MLQNLSKCEMWKFYNLPATQILRENKFWRIQMVQKCPFLTILEVLNFDFSRFEQLSSPKFTNIPSTESLKLPKMTKFDFM